METTQEGPNPTQTRPDEPELELYTVPCHSSWFSWDDINEPERLAFKEFFDGSSVSRTPKIYKEYRDFIINKYREDPSRRLTFTEVRKSLVGDVSLLHKVFLFLETWGLINFHVPSPSDGSEREERVRVEDGAPNGVRVVATPNSLRPISAPPVVGNGHGVVENGVKLPPLASYSDVFGDLKRLHCRNCGEVCDSEHYEYTKGDFIICAKCFTSGNYGENKSMDDFKLNDCSRNNGGHGAVWTEAETLLLLESVLKHGDNWELVAQNVKTKTKLDCISKFIELPFGDLLMSSTHASSNSSGPSNDINSMKEVPFSSSEPQEKIKPEDQAPERAKKSEQNGDTEDQEPPSKRKRFTSLLDASGPLMKQVSLISTMVGPDIRGAAAEAAVTALSDEISCPREIFGCPEVNVTNVFQSPNLLTEPERGLGDEDSHVTNVSQSPNLLNEPERGRSVEDSEMKEPTALSEAEETSSMKSDVPLPLRIRAAVATGLGAAAAHAKSLADQEERKIENLVAIILEAQLKKVNSKIKHFEDLEMIIEEEHTSMEELKECIIEERIDVLMKAFNGGLSKYRDHASVKSQNDSVC